MTSFEAAMWVFGIFSVSALIIGGIGAQLEESGSKGAGNIFLGLSVGLFGIGVISLVKALLGLVIN